jgi:hypothetical protein
MSAPIRVCECVNMSAGASERKCAYKSGWRMSVIASVTKTNKQKKPTRALPKCALKLLQHKLVPEGSAFNGPSISWDYGANELTLHLHYGREEELGILSAHTKNVDCWEIII